MTAFILIYRYQFSRGTCCLHLQKRYQRRKNGTGIGKGGPGLALGPIVVPAPLHFIYAALYFTSVT